MKNEPLSLDILLNIFFLWVNIFLFDFWNFLTFLTENKRSPTRLLLECRQSLFYIKHLDDFQKWLLLFCHLRSLKTFRREKSAWNMIISSTREFWNLRFKTKSCNFVEVRWRPYSPKESFSEDFIFNPKEALIRLLQNYLKRMEDQEKLISYACTRFSPLLGASLTLDWRFPSSSQLI